MKLTVVLSLFLVVQSFALQTYSQETTLSLNLKNVSIKKVLQEIEDHSEFYFLYNDDLVDVSRIVNIDVRETKIQEVLKQLFRDGEITYIIRDRQIILSPLDVEGNNPLTATQATRTVKGKVASATNDPIPGVTVLVKGTTTGTITDAEGNYTLTNVPRDAVLIFSFVGMKSQEVEVGNQTNIYVIMQEESVGIEEVVVTALGIEKNKKSLTYATQQVDMVSLTTVKEVNLGNALAGKVAGLTVATSSGAQGVAGDARITLRGDRSINNNNQPLVIVDGIPVSDRPSAYFELVNRTIEGVGAPAGYKMNSLSVVNPDDIESINVLKGPAASALYGSSAQNGVIVITTKKGKAGQSKLEMNSLIDFDIPYLYPEFQNEYAQGLNGIFMPNTDINSWGPKMTGQTVTDWTGNQTTLDPQPNNVKDFFKTGYNAINTVSYSAGVEKATAYISYSNTTSRGLLETNKMQRHNFNFRLVSEVVKNLKTDFKITYLNQKLEDDVDYGIDQFSVMYQLAMMPRSLRTSDIKNYYYYDEELSRKQNVWAPDVTSVNNPYWAMYAHETPSTNNQINTFASLRYDFKSWLYLQVRGGLNYYYNDSEQKTWWGTKYIWSGKGDYETAFNKSRSVTADALLAFNKELTKDLRLGVNIGAEVKDVYGRSMKSAAGGLSTENKFSLSYGENLTTSDAESRVQKQAVYAMGNLSFRDYLFLDVTARNDWSSTLPSPYRYFYPSYGITGIISEMVKLPEFISYLKVRGSYAEVGNDAQWAMILQTYSAAASGPVGFLSPSTTKVPVNLIPEKTKSWEAGTEIRLFENRLGVDFTWYKSNTFNQLILISSPPTSGFGSGWINCGNIQNKGIEVLINAKPIKTTDFLWNIDFNFSRNKNEVIELTESTTSYDLSRGNLSMGSIRAEVGRPYGEIYTKGFERNDAGQIVVDALGVPKVTSDYSFYLGNYNYDWRSGITNSFSYKNWHLSFLVDLNYGGVRQSVTEAHMLLSGTSKNSLNGREEGIIVEGVKEDGTPNDIVISGQSYAQRIGGRITNGCGEPFNHDATNSRLRELSLGYNFPLRSPVVKSLQVSVIGRNLFYLFNGCKWFDPDVAYEINVNGYGSESFTLPGTRTIGVNVKLVL
ncbi:MAG: SusC/RagA family TonB-linked outer membrane protein [Mangrovibacterium sp.]